MIDHIAGFRAVLLFALMVGASTGHARAEEDDPAEEAKKLLANLPADFKPYIETIPGTKVTFKMMPIPGGKFLMGSPDDQEGRLENEGPQTEVEVGPFWMGAYEVTWDEFDIFAFSYDKKEAEEAKKKGMPLDRTKLDVDADAVTRPTPPYVDMTFGYGHDRYPAICMTQHAASQYCKWLSTKLGKEYRLPTEAEWEFAARAGSKGPYHWGADPAKIGDYEWFAGNSDEKPNPVGQKKPNAFGLHDTHGNVSEWVRDKYSEDYFKLLPKPAKNPLFESKDTVWHAARGGAFRDDPSLQRVTVRMGAEEEWSIQDPQEPKSIWWHTDAHFIGFRIVRPYKSSGGK